MKILKKYIINLFLLVKILVKDLEVIYYKNYISKIRLKIRIYNSIKF